MQDWQQRVVEERDQLKERLGKLRAFIDNNPAFAALDVAERIRLRDQRWHMCQYLVVLDKRVAAFT